MLAESFLYCSMPIQTTLQAIMRPAVTDPGRVPPVIVFVVAHKQVLTGVQIWK